VRRIFLKAESGTIVERITACRDPTDDRFLEVAVNGGADVIVSGDRDLLVLSPFRGIPIITPIAFSHAICGVMPTRRVRDSTATS
jgi:predicted nucleic acid-binding protein